jgi:photosystem II stability/assembly factor-like uncharacterized protein
MGLHTILVNPNNPKQIWVAMSCVGVFRSDDAGQTWKVCNHNVNQVPTADVDPQNQIGRCAHKVCLDPDDPRTLYMQDHGGVYKSTDAADSWFKIENGLGSEGDERFGFPIAISRSGDLYLMPLKSSEERTVRGGRMILYRSTDRGASWHPVPGDFAATTQYVNVLRDGLCVDSLEQYGVYFGTSAGEVFYSTDRGGTWGRMPAQLPRVQAVKTWVIDG